MQIIDSTLRKKTFYATPEVEDINDIWLIRLIDTENGGVIDNFGTSTDFGYCIKIEFDDVDSATRDGFSYICEVYSLANQRVAYRTTLLNISEGSHSEHNENDFVTLD